jgi:acyl-coenzyme A synthetase/AMP-(fatty) acid ligase/pimeloyl-ACP methyl ester carboxylesterase
VVNPPLSVVGLPGVKPEWSRQISFVDSHNELRNFHALDTHPDPETRSNVTLTLVCVHGNPTWSFMWRNLLATAPSGVRVVAVDQIGMGLSDRTGDFRRLDQRVDDLTRMVAALEVTGPVVSVAHDWGGPVSLGWVESVLSRNAGACLIKGVVLMNTAVHQPPHSHAPALIRLARTPGILTMVAEKSAGFIRGTTFLSGSSMSAAVAAGYRLPYSNALRRRAVREFIADIPLEKDHPSAATLDRIAGDLALLDRTPVLLQWGPGDPVFSDIYLQDFVQRIPHADVHRYEGARHLVIEDAPQVVGDVWSWVSSLSDRPDQPHSDASVNVNLNSVVQRRSLDTSPAIISLGEQGGAREVSWTELATVIDRMARGLEMRGIAPGDRIAVLIPPGPDLIAFVYACWRIGAVVVITDAGLGIRGMRRAIRGAGVTHCIGIDRARPLLRTIPVPGLRLSMRDLADIVREGWAPSQSFDVTPRKSGDEAVVVFTSGSTGPAKGVVYTHGQIQRTCDLLTSHYGLTAADGLVAAFAPWAVLGPALGIASAIPDMDVTKPRTLTARALADATRAVNGTLMWASPAALANVVRTASDSGVSASDFTTVRLVLAAGAPVSAQLLTKARSLFPDAQLRTPYGMTEVLPVCDVTLEDILEAGRGNGVLVGLPLPGVEVQIAALDSRGRPAVDLTGEPEVTGEIAVRADHMRDRYDGLWFTNSLASQNPGWHRTGDVGHLDARGRVWIEGRLSHVITTSNRVVTPVAVEQAAQELDQVVSAACVGIGSPGDQQVVVVVTGPQARSVVASSELTSAIRTVTGVDVAAVLIRDELPVDIRHNAKINRTALALWADDVLSGHSR